MARQKHEIRGETGRCSQGLSDEKPKGKVVVAIQVEIKSKEQTWYNRSTYISLGTRAKIPSGYILNTLRTQTTCVSNMPSDQMLNTFRMCPAM